MRQQRKRKEKLRGGMKLIETKKKFNEGGKRLQGKQLWRVVEILFGKR